MSQESVEIVRRFNAAYEGRNLISGIEAGIGRLGPDLNRDAVLAWVAEETAWQHIHPDIEWDAWSFDVPPARGVVELAKWWVSWIEIWESYTYTIAEYRDLGEWVITPVEVSVLGRSGISVQNNMFQAWQVRDGKIVLVRIRPTEAQALRAVGIKG